MPGIYHGSDYDLVGTIVGVVDRAKIIDGTTIRPGDAIIGLPSSGPAHQRLFAGARNSFQPARSAGWRRGPTACAARSARNCCKVHTLYLPHIRKVRAKLEDQGHGAHHRRRADR